MKNRFSHPSNATTLPTLPPAQIAHQLPRADPLEYEVTSWYGVERVERILLNTCIKRGKASILRTFFQGFLAGFWVAIGGIIGNCMSGGVAAETRTAYPLLPHIGTALTFPLALHWILLWGGELYTGNCMVLAIGICNHKVTPWMVVKGLGIVYLGNMAGNLLTMELLSYQTHYFAAEPYLSYVKSVAMSKASSQGWNFGVLFLRAIGANVLVCMSVWLGIGARDGAGKFFHTWVPAVCFVLAGFEHSIANQFFVPCGMRYGADTTVGWFLYNQAAVALGNMVGGSLIMGVGGFALVHWGNDFLHPKQPEDLIVSVPDEKETYNYGMETPGTLPA